MREAPSGNHWNFIVQHSIIIDDEKGRTLLGFRLSAVSCAIRTAVCRNGVWEPFTEAKKGHLVLSFVPSSAEILTIFAHSARGK